MKYSKIHIAILLIDIVTSKITHWDTCNAYANGISQCIPMPPCKVIKVIQRKLCITCAAESYLCYTIIRYKVYNNITTHELHVMKISRKHLRRLYTQDRKLITLKHEHKNEIVCIMWGRGGKNRYRLRKNSLRKQAI